MGRKLVELKSSIKDHFLLGSGPGMYSYAFSLYRPQDFNQNPLFGLRFSQGAGIILEDLDRYRSVILESEDDLPSSS